jgi:hypothetical protein
MQEFTCELSILWSTTSDQTHILPNLLLITLHITTNIYEIIHLKTYVEFSRLSSCWIDFKAIFKTSYMQLFNTGI